MYTTISSTLLRGALRIYFVGAFLLIGLLGAACLKCSNRLALNRGRSVAILKTTGWLRFTDLLRTIYSLHRLPGGLLYGPLMLLASITSLTADLASSTLVYQQYTYDRCIFGSGLVVNTTSMNWKFPPFNSRAQVIATSSQTISSLNGGEIGVYKKANGAQNFSADTNDLLGGWKCSDVLHDITFAPTVLADDVVTSLQSYGLQYNYTWHIMVSSDSGRRSTQLIALSSSKTDSENEAFEVRASIDQGYNSAAEKVMKSYHCQVSSPTQTEADIIDTILSGMESNTTISEWINGLPSLIYDGQGTPASAYSDLYISVLLNTMTMVQGGTASLLSVPGPGEDEKQGCYIIKTYVSPFIIVLVGAVALMFALLFVNWVILLFRLSFSKAGRTMKGQGGLGPIPHGLLSWMLHATRERCVTQHGGVSKGPGKEKELRSWMVGVGADGGSGEKFARLQRGKGSGIVDEGEVVPEYVVPWGGNTGYVGVQNLGQAY
ncbi:hypothetical protein BGZ60DRAFT_561402 [Tricladium varicosporioides]|nr:hypothetical protein BGZ60DRAFT_561402 [Hymenoscyphus varicosporioides]